MIDSACACESFRRNATRSIRSDLFLATYPSPGPVGFARRPWRCYSMFSADLVRSGSCACPARVARWTAALLQPGGGGNVLYPITAHNEVAANVGVRGESALPSSIKEPDSKSIFDTISSDITD